MAKLHHRSLQGYPLPHISAAIPGGNDEYGVKQVVYIQEEPYHPAAYCSFLISRGTYSTAPSYLTRASKPHFVNLTPTPPSSSWPEEAAARQQASMLPFIDDKP
jgi:hypothetical protein